MPKTNEDKVIKHLAQERKEAIQFPLSVNLGGKRRSGGAEILQPPFPDGFLETLERLYENVFCTAALSVEAQGYKSVSAYVAYVGGEISCILLFTINKNTVTILNEIFPLAISEMEKFARYIFTTLDARTIIFPSVSLGAGRVGLLHQRFNSTEDIVISLPESSKKYTSALGKNMRSGIARFQRRIASDLPNMGFEFFVGDEVGASIIDQMIVLSKARIESKHQVATHTLASITKLRHLVKSHGVVVLASMEGRVCAGVICTNVAGNFFMHIIAHDPIYDKYRLGKICCYLSICNAIDRGAKEYHLLGGRYDYKYKFLGDQRDFERVVIYRSYASLATNIRLYSQTAFRGHGRRAKYLLKKYLKGLVETMAKLGSLFYDTKR